MKPVPFILLIAVVALPSQAQHAPGQISSSFVLQPERDNLKKNLYERTIRQTFAQKPDKESEYRYQSAFWAISQFMVTDSAVLSGLRMTLAAYDSLEPETRRAFLEALYTLNPPGFQQEIRAIFSREPVPKIFAMAALFAWRNEKRLAPDIIRQLEERFPAWADHPILSSLKQYLDSSDLLRKKKIPDPAGLFAAQRIHGKKMIYSFQRWNRDFPGMAIIQDSAGRFVRDGQGRLVTIRQLARSASNLPYFITNGNTPQGIFSIQGIDTSSNNFIGPTPNIQLLMPHEGYWVDYFHSPADSSAPQDAYLRILPAAWRGYTPMTEALHAGAAGRTEIIAHGTTIDPAWFAGRPFFPASPTLGCLCAPEYWNPSTGKLTRSEQYRLADQYMRASGQDGYLLVINLDDKEAPVSDVELERLVNRYEGKPPGN